MFILGLLPYSLGIAAAVVLPAILIARQEIAIEGPFGWSALTFTHRYPTKSWISRVYRSYSGDDKWATEYHLMSNGIWMFIYFVSFVYIALYSKILGMSDIKAWLGTVALAVTSLIGLNIAEDYLWFLIHPYFGPDRMSSKYVPWHKNFKRGIPAGYWNGMLTTIIIAGVATILLSEISILLVWLLAMVSIFVFCFGFKQGSKRLKRIPLVKYWWKNIKYVTISRCPWPIESEEPYIQLEAFVIPRTAMEELILDGKAIPLGKALAGKK